MFYVLMEITLMVIMGTSAGLLARVNACTARRCTEHAA